MLGYCLLCLREPVKYSVPGYHYVKHGVHGKSKIVFEMKTVKSARKIQVPEHDPLVSSPQWHPNAPARPAAAAPEEHRSSIVSVLARRMLYCILDGINTYVYTLAS